MGNNLYQGKRYEKVSCAATQANRSLSCQVIYISAKIIHLQLSLNEVN